MDSVQALAYEVYLSNLLLVTMAFPFARTVYYPTLLAGCYCPRRDPSVFSFYSPALEPFGSGERAVIT